MEQVRPQPAVSEPRRKSIFTEVGLVDDACMRRERSPAPRSILGAGQKRLRPARTVRFRSQHDILGKEENDRSTDDSELEELDDGEAPAVTNPYISEPTFANSRMYRTTLFAMLLVLMLPILQTKPLSSIGAKARVIPRDGIDPYLTKREDTDTQICKRWGHQCT